MNPAEVRLEARLGAIEYMIGQLFKDVYSIIGATSEVIEKSHQGLRDALHGMAVPTDDPAISDLVAGEMQEAYERLLGIIAEAARDTKR